MYPYDGGMPEDPKSKPARVGQILKDQRVALKLDLTDVELATKIRGKFLRALEASDYEALPNDIYSRNFVQHYASYLGLNGVHLAEQYLAERGGIIKPNAKGPQLERPHRMVVTVRLAVVAGIAGVVIILLLYLSYQLSVLAGAPRLSVSNPTNNQVVTTPTVVVRGSATPGANVLVDDIPVGGDSSGNFSTKVVLQNGLNSIRVVATSKLNKTSAATIQVLAKLPQLATPTASVPTATFNGVALAVRVSGGATSIVVTVDGKPSFNGIFLPGEQMVFQGTSDIKLTTSNAGNTNVTVTNQNVVGKIISPLGGQGEVRENQDFAAGSNFP